MVTSSRTLPLSAIDVETMDSNHLFERIFLEPYMILTVIKL